MHMYPRRQNVAAQVAEELKTVTYTMVERRRKKTNPGSFFQNNGYMLYIILKEKIFSFQPCMYY